MKNDKPEEYSEQNNELKSLFFERQKRICKIEEQEEPLLNKNIRKEIQEKQIQ